MFSIFSWSLIEEAKAYLNAVGMNSVKHESNDLGCKFNHALTILPVPFVHKFEQMLQALLSME